MTSLLNVRDLTVHFDTAEGRALAVDGVSFRIDPGETVGLVGESGCGKTVTALSILRLLDDEAVTSGASVIEFEGTNLRNLEGEDLRAVRGAKIAMIFQEPSASLNPVLTIGLQITETLHAHRDIDRHAAKIRAIDLLDLVGIPEPDERFRAYPHQLSGGMQQRVMIAIALSCEPKLLIADEPTTALDVTIQAQILSLLLDLKTELGMAMMLITHDLGVVAGMADRVAVMYGGQIVEEAPTNQLFASPQHPYTRALLDAIPRLDKVTDLLAAIPGSVPPATAWPSGCRFHPRCEKRLERCATDAPDVFTAGPDRCTRCWLAASDQATAS
jgi:oligopeptide/dipeptide ABC transporter ATP-binding protein